MPEPIALRGTSLHDGVATVRALHGQLGHTAAPAERAMHDHLMAQLTAHKKLRRLRARRDSHAR